MLAKKPGFSLLETMFVVFLGVILFTLCVNAMMSIRAEAKSTSRLKDIESIRNALNLYKQDSGFFPAKLTPGAPLLSLSGKVILAQVPSDPTLANCQTGDYSYTQLNGGASYQLNYCLTTKINSLTPGKYYASPSSLASPAP